MNYAATILMGFSFAMTLVCAAAVYWSVVRVERLRLQQTELASGLAASLRELELLAAMAAKAEVHSNRVERDYGGLAERVGVLELRGESRAYNQAIDSARGGADPAKLARQFGLSPSEASLVTLLHGAKRRA